MKTQLIRLSLVAGLLALFIPTVASAQGWPDYRRDRDYGRDRNYGRYDERYLRDSIHRWIDSRRISNASLTATWIAITAKTERVTKIA